MEDIIPITKQALIEALELSIEILKNIELDEIPLEKVALKTGRLARLLNDFTMEKIIAYEVGGYPYSKNGLPPDIYNLAILAGREYENTDSKKYMYPNSIGDLEGTIIVGDKAIFAAQSGHLPERQKIRYEMSQAKKRLSSRLSFIYEYVKRKYHELKFSHIPADVFSEVRKSVDDKIGLIIPNAIEKFTAIYTNLASNNAEDWANAVHSCRRVLNDLADTVFPATQDAHANKKNDAPIKLGKENYINRLMAFIENSSTSETYIHLFGAHIGFLGDRLDSIYKASNKGTHTTVTRTEANRYVVYTYMLLADVLFLIDQPIDANKCV